MKTRDKAMVWWGAGALLTTALLEWSLIDLSRRTSGLAPGTIFIWFFPCVLIPILFAVQIFHFRRMSRCQRLWELRYMVMYLPLLACGAVASRFGFPWRVVMQLAPIPLLILVPFWYAR